MENKFTDEDKNKVIDFLNFVATNATFKLNTDDVIKYYSLLAHMQKVILPKINDNIFEIISVTKPNDIIEDEI